ncbi:MAG: hypothetical protein JWN95_4119 [Frankiales bacterium]|nr:hypothetical protein [Frankiales bacterium]
MTSSATILALNPGSSSLKASVRTPELVLEIGVERMGTGDGVLSVTGGASPGQRPFTDGVSEAVDAIARELVIAGLTPTAVGHRVVHGGPKHFRPTVIDDQLVADLQAAVPLAPLHLPGDLAAIGHARRAWPQARHVACFDTGFHHDLPERSRRLPVSEELRQLGVRRYGFHGLSVQSVVDRHPDLGQAVIAHLGSGCSVTAVADGRPRHTSMSLTPTSGMLSGTRSGDLDPEIALYLIQQHGYTVDRLRTAFDRDSGLAGLAGGRHDVRDLTQAVDADAELALAVFSGGAAMAIAGGVTTLDRWDSLVFTGGVGEHASAVREAICRQLVPLRGGRDVVDAGSPGDAQQRLRETGLRVLVVTAEEDRVIDRLTRQVVPD